jgi:hypothetical protein
VEAQNGAMEGRGRSQCRPKIKIGEGGGTSSKDFHPFYEEQNPDSHHSACFGSATLPDDKEIWKVALPDKG